MKTILLACLLGVSAPAFADNYEHAVLRGDHGSTYYPSYSMIGKDGTDGRACSTAAHNGGALACLMHRGWEVVKVWPTGEQHGGYLVEIRKRVKAKK